MKAKKSSSRLVGRAEPKGLKLQLMDKRDAGHNAATRSNSYRTPFAYVCSGCNKPIKKDKFLLKACDKYWHENCLRCDRCHSRLGELGSTLYNKSNMNLCRQDYLEMFGETGICSVCEKHICASEMVMRAKQNVYHLECFACQLCNQRFCVGDRFYLCENKVVCQYDYEEHILPIQRSLLGQSIDRASGDQAPLIELESQSALGGLLNAPEAVPVDLDSVFVVPDDDNPEGVDGLHDEDRPATSLQSGVYDEGGKNEDSGGELTSLNGDDASKKDGSHEDKEVLE